MDYSLDIAISRTCPSNVKQSTALENKIEHSPLYTGCPEKTRASFSRQKSRNRRPPKSTKWLIKNCAANPAENDDLVTRKFSLRRSPTVRWIFLNVVEKQSESGALVLGHWVKGEIGDPYLSSGFMKLKVSPAASPPARSATM